MHTWKVVPLSKGQLLDVRSEDVVHGGHFRKCNTYRGGGGYDKFPIIAKKEFGKDYHHQFIVQLFGCNLDCPYCYVTRAGVWGQPVPYTSQELIEHFKSTNSDVFHLMGGAPALYMEYWYDIISRLPSEKLFHSDIMLSEREYQPEWLQSINSPRAMYAVNIKGMTNEEHLKNTRKPLKEKRVWNNLTKLVESGVKFYFTFTNVSPQNQDVFWKRYQDMFGNNKKDSFGIDLIEYDALPHVDDVPWGRKV